jgi:RimJ/RimL family protein N-acetyltransferase
MIEHAGRCVGHTGLGDVDARDRRARLVIGLFDRSVWNRGLGTEAIRLVLGYAFDTLRLHRVALRVLAYNARAIRAYEKCGFVREGVERESAFVAGEWHDDVMMAVLDRDFRALCARVGSPMP